MHLYTFDLTPLRLFDNDLTREVRTFSFQWLDTHALVSITISGLHFAKCFDDTALYTTSTGTRFPNSCGCCGLSKADTPGFGGLPQGLICKNGNIGFVEIRADDGRTKNFLCT